MLQHYIKVAYRYLTKNKTYSIISIFGLSIALCLVSIIIGFIQFQLSFNKYHSNYKNTYRILNVDSELFNRKSPSTPYILGTVLENKFPEVKQVSRIMNLPFHIGQTKVKKGDEFIDELNFFSADQELFSILDIPLLSQSTKKLLADPGNIVLSESMAKKYFDEENPLGKTLTIRAIGKSIEMKVTGVMFDFPENSSIQADFFCSLDNYINLILPYYRNEQDLLDSWEENQFVTYIELIENADVKNFEQKLNDLIHNSHNEIKIQFQLQALQDIYYKSSDLINDDYTRKGDIRQIYLFSGIVVVILLVAVINYVLLTTARSIKRYKEIGIKKVFGIRNLHLVFQLIIESIVIALISLVISGFLIILIKDHLDLILLNDIDYVHLWNWEIIGLLIAITLLAGVFSGIYISIQVVALNPVNSIKNIISFKSTKFDIKIGLIIFQIASFIILTIFTIFIYMQVRFAMKADLGINKEDLIIIRFDPNEFFGYFAYKNTIKQNPNIINISGAFLMPPANASSNVKLANVDDPENEIIFENYNVDFHFFKTLGIKIIEGRGFDDESANDINSSILINKKVLTDFGIKNPVGKKIGDRRIIGVADNIHVHSFHLAVQPAIFNLYPAACQHIAVRTRERAKIEVLEYLAQQWEIAAPDIPFYYYFIDDELKQYYEKDIRFGKSITLYSLVAIVISILGLFGLSLFLFERKTKEITIRKVHGASNKDIAYLLIKQFLKFTIIANVISLPIAYLLVDKWLQNFSYRINILENWWVFAIAFLLSFLIIFITLGFKAWQITKLNPVENLKYE